MAAKRPTVSIIDEVDQAAPEAAPAAPARAPRARPAGIQRTTLYLPQNVHDAIREVAFHHRVKPHDVIMQGIDLVLRTKYGMTGIEKPKAQK